VKLAAQEHLLSGDTAEQKWLAARRLGLDGIELRGTGKFGLAERLPELRAARRQGAVFSSVCIIMDNFVGDYAVQARRDAIDNLKSQLTVIAELDGRGVITPAGFGKTSRALPSPASRRTPDEDRAVLLDGLAELAAHAEREGVKIFIEPLNRYEDAMINTLAEAAAYCRALASGGVQIMGDLFHMSIEEADPAMAIRENAGYLGHIHVADSNRLEPGRGHTDFAAPLKALRDIEFEGFLALECRLSGPAEAALANAVQVMRAADEEN